MVVFHYVGQVPLKKSQTMQVSWHDIMLFASSPVEDGGAVSPEVANALEAGLTGSAITLAYPVLETQNYHVAGSVLQVGPEQFKMQQVTDISELIKQDLEEKLPGIWFRLATRAVLRRIAAVQARHAVESGDDAKRWGSAGWLAEMAVSAFGAAMEKADTRQWFTLPAQIYMTRAFVTPGTQDIKLLLTDRNGNIVGEHIFEGIAVPKAKRIFLHYRTAY